MTSQEKTMLSLGLEQLRAKGINFTRFKEVAVRRLHNAHLIKEDDWVEFYNNYAITYMVYTRSITEYIKDAYCDRDIDNHDVVLKSSIKSLNHQSKDETLKIMPL